MRMKRLLVIGGIILILTGMILMMWPEPVEEEKSIWEKIPDEEIHTNIEEEGAAENIPEYETYSKSEEAAQELGSYSGQECSRHEEADKEVGQIVLTAEEKKRMMQLGAAEAESEGEDGQWLVMSAVWNRVLDSEWPDNVIDVINHNMVTKDGRKIYQFSCVGDGRIDAANISEDSEEALERILKGDIAPEIVAFEVTSSNVLDEWFEYAFTFKNHKFYTKKH